MGAVSTLPAFLDALRAALAGLDGLSGVSVFSANVSPDEGGKEFICLAIEEVEPTHERLTAPKREVFESYDVPCLTWVAKPGSGETVIKITRDRAFAILEAVIDYLDGITGSTTCAAALSVRRAKLEGVTVLQEIGESQRNCKLSFTIHVEAEFTPA